MYLSFLYFEKIINQRIAKRLFKPELIKNHEMPKGDPVTLAEVAAVFGVKRTSDLIPLCHPLPIDHTSTKIVLIEP